MLKGTLEHELDGFLKWNPPILVPHPNHTSSAKTRPPTAYDLHLHEDLVLKEIKLLPDLLTDLAGVVDIHIESYKQSIPNPVIGPGFPTYAERRHFSMPDIINESTLVSIYQDTTIEYSTLVASSLLFGRPFSCDDRLLRWTAGSNHSKAIADGFLKIDHNNLKLSELGPASTALPESMKTNIKLLSNWDFEDLMIWEFKSLVAADMEKMQSIGDLVGPFNWIACGDENRHCAEPKADGSRKSHRNLDGTWVKTGRKTGPDAKSTPWALPNAASKPKRGKKRKIDDEYQCLFSPEAGKTAKNVGLDPRYIMQQMWAEAVRNDATIIVLHAGNYEYIGIRHRDTQTLYISKLVCVHDHPNYGQLHTALCIAAFWDAVDRAKQMETSRQATLSPRYSRSYGPSSKKPNSAKSKAAAIESDQWMLSQLQQTKTIKINSRLAQRHFYAQYPLLIQRKHMTFHNPTPKKLVLTLERSIGDRIFLSALEAEQTAALTGSLVIKLAKLPEERENLRAEYHYYDQLTKKIPSLGTIEYLGLYFHKSEDDKFLILVMTNGGESLRTRIRKLSEPIRKKFIKLLDSLHRQGFVHGAIDPAHLLINDSGDVSIVSWRRCKHYDREKLRNGQYPDGSSEMEVEKVKVRERADLLKWLPV